MLELDLISPRDSPGKASGSVIPVRVRARVGVPEVTAVSESKNMVSHHLQRNNGLKANRSRADHRRWIGLREMGLWEMGLWEMGLWEMGPSEMGARDMGPREIRLRLDQTARDQIAARSDHEGSDRG